MLNKLEALRYFCSAAETLHFSETAMRLSVSPQVVTRMIAELEALLGEPLFKRNTRNIHLTPFGHTLLPQAQKLLAQSEALFSGSLLRENGMAGVVRITLPPLHDHEAVLFELFEKLHDYPAIMLDWRIDTAPLNLVDNQIDIGIRVGAQPDPRLIVRPIMSFQEAIVAAPALIARLGAPQDVNDLLHRYPLSSMINPETGRVWGWQLGDGQHLNPKQPHFVCNNVQAEIQAALAGRCCAQLVDYLIAPYLANGRLVRLFPDMAMPVWQIYLYRPYLSVTSARVRLVFDLLTAILQRRYGQAA